MRTLSFDLFFCFVKLLVITISGREARYLFLFSLAKSYTLALVQHCSKSFQTRLQFLSNIYPALKEGTLKKKMLSQVKKNKIVVNKTNGDAEIRRHNALSLPMQSAALLIASRSQKAQPTL